MSELQAKLKSQSSLSSKALGSLFVFVLFAVSAAFFYYYLAPIRRSIVSKNWQAISCEIAKSNVIVEGVTHDEGGDKSINSRLALSYSYEIDGKRYQSTRYGFSDGFMRSYDANKLISSRFLHGAKVICYVNPYDPADAVLFRGFDASMALVLFPLGFVLVISFIVVHSAFRYIRKTRQSR